MKNSFTKKIVSLVALLTLPIMTGCGKTDTPSKQDSHSVEVSSKDQPSTGGEETHTHTFESHSAVAATCSKTGNKAYDFCTGCQKYFINGQEVSADSITLPIDPTNHNLKNVASTATDCKTMGVIAHQECNDCHKLFVNGVEKTASELQGYGEHKLSDVAAVPHSCTVDGKIAYKHCSVCGKNFVNGVEKSDKDLVDPAAHTLSHVAGSDASCTKDGTLAHDHCSVCGKNFINGVEKSDNDLKVPGGQGHDFSGDSLICKNGCGAYKALYNGEYVTLSDTDAVKFVASQEGAAIYSPKADAKAVMFADIIDNPLTFIAHRTNSSDKGEISISEDGTTYNYFVKYKDAAAETGGGLATFTRFTYKKDFVGTLLLSFDVTTDVTINQLARLGLTVQTNDGQALTNDDGYAAFTYPVGSKYEVPRTLVAGVTYRMLSKVDLFDHANETLAMILELTADDHTTPTVQISNLMIKEVSTTNPNHSAERMLAYYEGISQMMTVDTCPHHSKDTIEGNATCSVEGTLTHEHCLACNKNLINNVVVESVTGKLAHDAGTNPLWKSDETGHWHECVECGGKTDFAAHTPDPTAVPGVDDVYCTVCSYKISAGVEPHTHNFEKVDAVPTCSPNGGHPEYYKCNCGMCSIDAQGTSIIEEPATVRDILHSTHSYDSSDVCTICGAHKYVIPFRNAAAEEISGTAPQIRTDGKNSAAFPVSNPGLWGIQASNNGAEIVDNESILASTVTASSGASKGCFVRIVPNANIKQNGGTFLASFDLTPQDNQVGNFNFGVVVQNNGTNVGTNIATEPVKECVISKVYHVEVLVQMEAGNYFQLTFKNATSGNVKVRITNFSFVEYASTANPTETILGVKAVSWPWAD